MPISGVNDHILTSFELDYIQGMGFTAIWITPVTGQLTQDTGDGEAYHGYWQQKMYKNTT
jgi:alpha-amylase